MTMFKKQRKQNVIPELTSEIAQSIYPHFLTHEYNDVDVSGIMIKYGFYQQHIYSVLDEVERLRLKAKAYCVANETVNKNNLTEHLSSDMLCLDDVVRDIVKFNPDYDEDRTFAEFRSAYPYVGSVEVKLEDKEIKL